MLYKDSLAVKIIPDISQNVSPSFLYHYTSADALINIIKNKKIWFSHIYYLNDVEEFKNGWRELYNYLKAYKITSVNKYFISEIKKVIGPLENGINTIDDFIIDEVETNPFYVFSLSGKRDDLSQWRSYTQPAQGYSLGIEFNRGIYDCQKRYFAQFVPKKENNSWIIFGRCIYSDGDKKKKMTALIKQYIIKSKSIHDKDELMRDFISDFSIMAAFFKNEKFKEEDEYRLAVITLPAGVVNKETKYRAGRGFIIPYIEFDLPIQYIREILIGPTPNPIHSKASVSKMIRQYNKGDEIQIENTKVPYRAW